MFLELALVDRGSCVLLCSFHEKLTTKRKKVILERGCPSYIDLVTKIATFRVIPRGLVMV